MHKMGIYITESVIIGVAARLQSSLNFSSADNEQLNLNFSNAWIAHGESGDANREKEADFLAVLFNFVEKYH